VNLALRRANASRISGYWQNEDYDVFDGEREVGRKRAFARGELLALSSWGGARRRPLALRRCGCDRYSGVRRRRWIRWLFAKQSGTKRGSSRE
jgi:hypothetical protein